MNGLQTRSDLSQATCRASAWFSMSEHRYAFEDQLLFHKLLGLIEKPLHILVLDEELRRRMLPSQRTEPPSLVQQAAKTRERNELRTPGGALNGRAA